MDALDAYRLSSSASLGFTSYSQADTLDFRYKSVNFGANSRADTLEFQYKPVNFGLTKSARRNRLRVREQQTNPPGHLWCDKWTALSGPLSERGKDLGRAVLGRRGRELGLGVEHGRRRPPEVHLPQERELLVN